MTQQALRIIVSGRVQGVGFRPFVSRLAHQYGLQGWVRNCSGQVEIHIEGPPASLAAFQVDLIDKAPPLAKPEQHQVFRAEIGGLVQFVIHGSVATASVDNHIPPDYFVCDDCLAEMQNPAERRYRYPFINCTQCGPRYTLIDSLPYDRPNTAMRSFALCPACQDEYSDPLDRRYHAQPLACAECGPSLIFRQPGQPDVAGDAAALQSCLAAWREGSVVAVKGVGGYHLLCDATNFAAVAKLRQRKARPHKPLAVLLPWQGEDGLDWLNRLAEADACEREALCSPLRPIVLIRKKAQSLLTENIAPELGEVGLMLPYSPLHHLLLQAYGLPLVATSANLSGEPVLTDAASVEQRLGRVADAFLHHNRPILRPADDSVLRRIAGQTRPIRVGRGLAPLEHKLPVCLPHPVLALGADLKNTIALGFDDRIVISPHIGELGSPRGLQVFEQVISDLQRLYAVQPVQIVCDAHPGYHTSRWARQQDLPVQNVYHHHAHASALLGEYAVHDQTLVFTWDGTGYGEDGTIWGGEALLGRPGQWQRVASLRPFRLPGGDKASRDPWRSALALCWEAGQAWPDAPRDVAVLQQAWRQQLNCPTASSAGRLFDAAAALIGIAHGASYEGHAAMKLEAMARPGHDPIPLPLSTTASGLLLSDWQVLLPMLLQPTLSPATKASLFHASLAGSIVDQACAIRHSHGVQRVGLSGGVFQNRLLTEQSLTLLQDAGFEVLLHRQIPAGDGGISFGQLIEAAAKLAEA